LPPRYPPAVSTARLSRAPKVYEPSGLDVQLSIPQREHGLLAGILLEAVLSSGGHADARQAALAAAAEQGRLLGEAERSAVRGRLGAERALTLAEEVLERYGFEPIRCNATLVRLGNCPFHPFAAQAVDLVCGINHAFLTGFLEGVGASTVHAALVPRPGACCVEIGAAPGLTA
jgi:predicted ArsR family transcriptional regulator